MADFKKLSDQEVINVLDTMCAVMNKISEHLTEPEQEAVGGIYSDVQNKVSELYAECSNRKINLNN